MLPTRKFLPTKQGCPTARYETQGQNGNQKYLSRIESDEWAPQEPHEKGG